VLVAAWIAVIVALQVRGTDAPDFRPQAEKFLIQLSQGSDSIAALYDSGSPRFQELERKQQFIDKMMDMRATIGQFKEIAAVNETLVTTGPTGRVGRVGLTAVYEKCKCKMTVSLHYQDGEWKFLGVGLELPPEVKITQEQREERIQACKDPMDPRTCDVYVAANTILEQLRDGKAGEVWDNAGRVFKQQETRERFIELHRENAAALGEFRRIIAVSEAKVTGTNVTYDVLLEYAKAQGVRAIFGFYRGSSSDPLRLRSLKIVLPMPRAGEAETIASPFLPEALQPSPKPAAPETPAPRAEPAE